MATQQSQLEDDALFCQEDYSFDDNINEVAPVVDDDDDNICIGSDKINNKINDGVGVVVGNGPTRVKQMWVYEQDLLCCGEDDDDGELASLLSKEMVVFNGGSKVGDPCLVLARNEAVDWMLRAHSHHFFTAQTALLAVNYFDRFMFRFEFQRDKHWMSQLVAVACLSLAAKVEETHVPLLVEFQVEESKYVFEAKTIQRMEILVLSTLEWKMNAVTSYSFLDYLIRRIPLKEFLCWEFVERCERIMLATLRDSRFIGYLPSTMAAATFLHVINCFEPYIGDEYQKQLFDILGIDKVKVEECCQLIFGLAAQIISRNSVKRKSVSRPGSPNGVIDVSFSSDSSNDSWAVASVSSPEPLAKKIRTVDHHLERCNHPSVDFFSILP